MTLSLFQVPYFETTCAPIHALPHHVFRGESPLVSPKVKKYLRASVQCFFYYIDILMMAFMTIFRRFLTIFRRFPKISKIVRKARRTFPNVFQKLSEDFRGTRRCFDHTPTNVSTTLETSSISVKSSISGINCRLRPSNFLLVRSEHAHASYPGLSFRPPGFSS